jgi:hypothetical protein
MLRGLGLPGATSTATQEATGTTALTAFLRAWKLHPPGYTAAELAGMLQAAADYGTKINAGRPLEISTDYNPRPMLQAIAAATSEAAVWRGRMPWPWQTTIHYGKTDPKVIAVQKRITGLYGDAAGVKTAAAVVAKARKELKDNLTNPDRWAWWQKLKPFAIVGGVIVGAAVAYPYVKPILSRAGSKAA